MGQQEPIETYILFFCSGICGKKKKAILIKKESKKKGNFLSSFIFQVPSLDLPRLRTGLGLSYAGPEGCG